VDVLEEKLRRTPRATLRHIPDRHLRLALPHRVYQERPGSFRSCNEVQHGAAAEHTLRFIRYLPYCMGFYSQARGYSLPQLLRSGAERQTQEMKRFFTLLIILGSLGLSALAVTPSRPDDEEDPYFLLCGQADRAIADGDYEEAAARLIDAISIRPAAPESILLMSNLGMVYSYMERDSLALATLNEAHRRAPAMRTVIANRAKEFLKMLGMPKAQQADICCYVLLAMAGIKQDTLWKDAGNEWIRIHDIIQFANTYYGSTYAENSRETFRKQALHHFRNAALVEDNGKATNSPNHRYRLTEETLQMVRTFQTSEWQKSVSRFLEYHEKLVDMYASKKKMTMMPVRINGADFQFSIGRHNELQKAIIQEFAPRFAPNSECLYVGDTIEKDLVKNVDKLKELGFEITLHDKMPDVVLYREDKDWIYFVESVTSVGPMDAKRILEITEMTKSVAAGKIFVTAFLDFKTYKRFSENLAWETEVWIAEMPEHMIHLNGDKFLGPR